jgi:ribosomal protein L34E
MTKPEEAEMPKPEACASCGALELAGWVTGRLHSFKKSPHHRGREVVLYLCSSCFTMELAAQQRDHINLRSMELFSR